MVLRVLTTVSSGPRPIRLVGGSVEVGVGEGTASYFREQRVLGVEAEDVVAVETSRIACPGRGAWGREDRGVGLVAVKGTNGAYRAVKGWDACTGLGSPDGTKLLNAITT